MSTNKKREAIVEATGTGWQTEWTDKRTGQDLFGASRQATLDGAGRRTLADYANQEPRKRKPEA